MGEHRSMVLRRFAPVNQEGDYVDLDSVVYGQIYIDIVLLRSIMIDLECMRPWAIRILTCAVERACVRPRENATHP